MKIWDVIIIGGGASGMTAAITAGRIGTEVLLLEAGERLGKKLLATGNGRCNMSNRTLFSSPDNIASHYGLSREFVKAVFSFCPPEETSVFFNGLGVLFHEDRDGRLYPRSMQASSVQDALRLETFSLCSVHCSERVKSFTATKTGWHILTENNEYYTRSLILAMGCVAGGGIASTILLENSRIRIKKDYPALAPVPVNPAALSGMKGVRAHATVSVISEGKLVASSSGEVQFNQNSLSGICVFDISRFTAEWFSSGTICGRKCNCPIIELDLMPEYSESELSSMLFSQARLTSGRSAEYLLTGWIPKRAATALLKLSGIDFSATVADIKSASLRRLAAMLKHWRFIPTGSANWELAQTAGGGINESEFRFGTPALKSYHNLYACGDLLAPLGDCGGYNLQWAWSTGILAGKMAAGQEVHKC